jgi:methyl-accepting chemotaxis protein
MNFSLLLPSTLNIVTVILNLISQNSQIASQALSDLFIIVIIGIAICLGSWAVKLTIDSLSETGRYLNILKNDENAVNLMASSDFSLFRQLQHHLIRIPSRDGNGQTLIRRTVDGGEIFSDSILAPNFTTSRLFLAIPGILTGLGVLGTFVGLQIGIGGLNLNDLTNLEKSVVPLIQGCAIAFSTSVWGVLTSLLFSGLEKGLEGKAIGRIRKLQNRVDTLISRYVPEDAMAEMERASRGTEEILKGLAVAIGDEMQKAIGRLGKEVKEAVEKATSEGQSPLAEKSAELLATALTAELGNLKNQIGSMAEQFSEQFTGASGELMASVKSFEPTVKTLSETVGNSQRIVVYAVQKLNAHEMVMEKMASAAAQIQQAAETFSTMNQTLEIVASGNEEAAKAQLSAASSNERVAEKFDDIAKKLPSIQETLKDAAQVIASISGPISDLKTYLQQLPDVQKKEIDNRNRFEDERNQRLLVMTSDLAEKVGNAAEQFTKVGDLAERLAASSESLDSASKELSVFGKQVFDASNKQLEASNASRAAALSGERAAKSFEPIPGAITGLTTGLQTAGNSVRMGAEAARDSYRELTNLQNQWFKGAEHGLNAMKDRLQEIIKAYGQQIEGQTKNLMTQWTQEVTECLKTYQTQVDQLQGDIDELQAVLSRLNRS